MGLESRIDRYLRQRLGLIGRGITVKAFEGEDAEFEFDSLANREPVFRISSEIGSNFRFLMTRRAADRRTDLSLIHCHYK